MKTVIVDKKGVKLFNSRVFTNAADLARAINGLKQRAIFEYELEVRPGLSKGEEVVLLGWYEYI
jgi:hypothetical protein